MRNGEWCESVELRLTLRRGCSTGSTRPVPSGCPACPETNRVRGATTPHALEPAREGETLTSRVCTEHTSKRSMPPNSCPPASCARGQKRTKSDARSTRKWPHTAHLHGPRSHAHRGISPDTLCRRLASCPATADRGGARTRSRWRHARETPVGHRGITLSSSNGHPRVCVGQPSLLQFPFRGPQVRHRPLLARAYPGKHSSVRLKF